MLDLVQHVGVQQEQPFLYSELPNPECQRIRDTIFGSVVILYAHTHTVDGELPVFSDNKTIDKLGSIEEALEKAMVRVAACRKSTDFPRNDSLIFRDGRGRFTVRGCEWMNGTNPADRNWSDNLDHRSTEEAKDAFNQARKLRRVFDKLISESITDKTAEFLQECAVLRFPRDTQVEVDRVDTIRVSKGVQETFTKTYTTRVRVDTISGWTFSPSFEISARDVDFSLDLGAISEGEQTTEETVVTVERSFTPDPERCEAYQVVYGQRYKDVTAHYLLHYPKHSGLVERRLTAEEFQQSSNTNFAPIVREVEKLKLVSKTDVVSRTQYLLIHLVQAPLFRADPRPFSTSRVFFGPSLEFRSTCES